MAVTLAKQKLLINRFTSMTTCLVQTLSMTPLNYNPSYKVYFLKVASYSGKWTTCIGTPSPRADWHPIYSFFLWSRSLHQDTGNTVEFVDRQFLSQCCWTTSSLISHQTSPCVWYWQDHLMYWDGFPLAQSRPRSSYRECGNQELTGTIHLHNLSFMTGYSGGLNYLYSLGRLAIPRCLSQDGN